MGDVLEGFVILAKVTVTVPVADGKSVSYRPVLLLMMAVVNVFIPILDVIVPYR